MFYCVATIRAGRSASRKTPLEIPGLHADVDFKDVADDEATILRRVRELRLPAVKHRPVRQRPALRWEFKEPDQVNTWTAPKRSSGLRQR